MEYFDTALLLPKSVYIQIGLAAVLAIALLAVIFRQPRWGRRMEEKRRRAERERYVKYIIMQRIADSITDAWLDNEITPDEANEWFTKFVKQFGLWDLVAKKIPPSPPDPTKLKEEIKARRAREKGHSVVNRVQLPDGRKPKSLLQAILAKHSIAK